MTLIAEEDRVIDVILGSEASNLTADE